MDARKEQLDRSLNSGSVVSWAWACASTAEQVSQDFNCVHLEGFIHNATQIRLGSLKRVLPENRMMDAGEIIRVAFEEVHPGPGNDYMDYPSIQKFLMKPRYIRSLQTQENG